MKILVTGGAGFIGSHLSKALLDRGDEVVVIDNFNDFYDVRVKEMNVAMFKENPKFSLERGDITDFPFLEKVFSKHKIDKIMHLAAYAGVPHSIKEPRLYTYVNVDGTVNLLDLSIKHKVKNFVFASSSSVYGGRTKVPFKETDLTNRPISPYAATKAAGELICYTYHHIYKMPTTCLRFFTVYGPNQRPYGMAHQKFMKQIYRGIPVTLYGDGGMARDFTYIDDIVSGIMSALDKNLPFEVVNLGNSDTVTLIRLISTIESVLGKKAVIENLPVPPTEVPITYADITYAKKVLGYSPKTSIEEGVKKQVAFFLNAPDWYKDLPI